MGRVQFELNEMAMNFIAGLQESGYTEVNKIDSLIDNSFCIIGNNVYFLIRY